ncbi:hypothetical protein BN1007_110042 [Klebsiella variicola]|nr:hypothetical protein BN1007_110042 [Klebsiella variicola]
MCKVFSFFLFLYNMQRYPLPLQARISANKNKYHIKNHHDSNDRCNITQLSMYNLLIIV